MLEESEGSEPSVPVAGTSHFECDAFDHSANSPRREVTPLAAVRSPLQPSSHKKKKKRRTVRVRNQALSASHQ